MEIKTDNCEVLSSLLSRQILQPDLCLKTLWNGFILIKTVKIFCFQSLMATINKATLHCEGKGFGLPHSDVNALAAACALRAANVDFRYARPVGHLPTLVAQSWTAKSTTNPAKEEVVSCKGVSEIFALLARNGSDLDTGLTNEQRVYCGSVSLIFAHQIIPAFDFLSLALEEHASIREGNRSDPNSLFSIGLSWLGWGRRSQLSTIATHYHISTIGSALAVAAAALKSIEDLIRLVRSSNATRNEDADGFIFTTTKPSTLDCLAFAAGSVFLYAEFDEKYGEIRAWQIEQRRELPRLVELTEAVRKSVFGSTQTAFFTLKPILPSADSSSYDGEKPFREGRFRFLAATAAFASLYFLVTNAATVVQVLEAVEGGLEDDEGEE